MSLWSKFYAFLQSGTGTPGGFYSNSTLHIQGGAWITLLTLELTKFSKTAQMIALAVLIALAAWKEFYFDMRDEVPKQNYGSIRGPGALNDFVAYMIGILLGEASYGLVSLVDVLEKLK